MISLTRSTSPHDHFHSPLPTHLYRDAVLSPRGVRMEHIIVVEEETLTTRQRAEFLVQTARENDCSVLDLSRVEFMSRSVADEFRYHQEKGAIELVGLSGSAKEMFDIVNGKEIPA